MKTTFASAAWPACHSALRLDRWMAGELPRDDAETLEAHVQECGPCRTAVEELEQARAAPLPPLRAPATRRAPRSRWTFTWGSWAAGLGVTAAAAAFAGLVFLVPPSLETRRKGAGAPELSMYVRHDGQTRRAGPGEAVEAGDAVRFTITQTRPAYVAVLSLDPAGRASVYFPAGDRAEAVEAGVEVALPLATRLDATVGEERVFGLFCDRPLRLAPVRGLVDAAADGGAPEGCVVTRWSFVKR